ncbi:MAG TPA: hypothetical protein VFZ98_09325, partial [Vicinamibacterales bacterium]
AAAVMNPTADLAVLFVASVLLVCVFWVAVTTRSRAVRFTLIGFVLILFFLMVWNLHTHGGFHAI